MIRPIMKVQFFLEQPSAEADPGNAADAEVARDLVDTLEASRATCVGMAANMIGQRKRIIAVVDEDGAILLMFNPRVVRGSGPYTADEGCLSLEGTRKAKRYRSITVAYQDKHGSSRERQFEGLVAQAVQHEIDHCNGILI